MSDECPRCEEPTGGVTHTNPTVGFADVCNACQLELHTAYSRAQAARRAAAIAANAPPTPKPAGG